MAYEGESVVTFFEGSYDEYEADRRQRTGGSGPAPIKFKPMPSFL
jgi:sulfate-transporting ATPase